MNLEELKRKMDKEHYIYDDTLSTVLYVALQLGRPLLIEGAAGVGKTEVAKVMAAALDRELVRLQCYEGLDESKALYEWNYQKQLLSIQVNMNAQDREALTRSLFSDEYLLERPLLKSIRSEKPVVLLIDDRFAAPDTRRLMPPHWADLGIVNSCAALQKELQAFWGK